jgi:polyisoprenoid-binding protein YceI
MSTPNTLPHQRSSQAISGRWRLDPQRSSVEFRVKHFWGLVTVKGQFHDYHGQLDLTCATTVPA